MRSTQTLRSYPDVAFETVPVFVSLTMALSFSLVLSRKIVDCFFFSRHSPPGDRWFDFLGFVPVGSVSSSSTLQFFRDASHALGIKYIYTYKRRRKKKKKTTHVPQFLTRFPVLFVENWRLKVTKPDRECSCCFVPCIQHLVTS